jgi:hypothetical protein
MISLWCVAPLLARLGSALWPLAGDEQWQALDSAALEVQADLLLDFENIVEATGS